MQTFSGLEWIKIDVANRFGKDKMLWQERIDWFNFNEHQLDSLADRADKPILYRKALRAYHKALRGEPINHPIALDSTASGIQIMALLMRCETTAKNVNLINTGKREDVYAKVGNTMGESRDTVKKPIMTYMYGSTAQPKAVFGEGTPRLTAFHSALSTELPGAVRCMRIMQKCWKPDATHHEFTAPDGHTAYVPVMVQEKQRIKLGDTSFTHTANVLGKEKKGLSLAANATHLFDGYIVREMVRKANEQGFEILVIHDDFACLPNHVNKMRRNYLDIVIDMAKRPLLVNWYNELNGTNLVDIPQTEIDTFVSQLHDSEYFLS